MRLAFLTHEPYFPPSGGGSAEAIYLIRELVRRNHEIHLFCPVFPIGSPLVPLMASTSIRSPDGRWVAIRPTATSSTCFIR